MTQNAIRMSLSLWLLGAPALAWAQQPAVYKLPPPRIACDASSGVLDQNGHVVIGSVRKQCDALWNRSLKEGGVGAWRYDDFMSQCAQSCAAPLPLSQASSVPQLNTLGAQAAGAGGGSGATFFVAGGVAAVIGAGIALSSGTDDEPASP